MMRFRFLSSVALAAALFTFGCASAPKQPQSDGGGQWLSSNPVSLSGKRIAILSCDESVAARWPAALALRPEAPVAGETQKQAEQRRLRDLRQLGALFAVESKSDGDARRAARAELIHHAFASAFLAKKIELVERERMARVFGEQRLNGEDDPAESKESRKRDYKVDVLPCDYVLIANPIVDRVEYDYAVNPASLPMCLLIAPIFLLASESADLNAAIADGSIAVAAPTYHTIRARKVLGLSARLIDINTGEIVWVGNAHSCADQTSGLVTGKVEGGSGISDMADLVALANRLVDGLPKK